MMQRPMIRLYDLRDQDELIARMQRARLGHSAFGVAADPLVGSDGWWERIRSGELAVQRLDGTITRSYWSGMADWPVFEMSDGEGKLWAWSADDRRRLVVSLQVRVDYLEEAWRGASGLDCGLVLGIWVEDSLERIDGIPPGPEGCGYELTRRDYGDAMHYLRVFSREAAEGLLAELEQDGRVGTVWRGGTNDFWYVQISATEADAKSEIAIFERLASSRGGRYDGGEVVGGDVWGPLLAA